MSRPDVECYVLTHCPITTNRSSLSSAAGRVDQHRGIPVLRAEVKCELCVELIYNYCFKEHSFSFACASIFKFTCILIRLNDISLNCVVISHALIHYTHLFLKCLLKTYAFHLSNTKYMNPSRETIPLIRPHQCDYEGGRIRGVYCSSKSGPLKPIEMVEVLFKSDGLIYQKAKHCEAYRCSQIQIGSAHLNSDNSSSILEWIQQGFLLHITRDIRPFRQFWRFIHQHNYL